MFHLVWGGASTLRTFTAAQGFERATQLRATGWMTMRSLQSEGVILSGKMGRKNLSWVGTPASVHPTPVTPLGPPLPEGKTVVVDACCPF